MQTDRVAAITGELRAEIARQGLSQKVIAQAVGLSDSGLSQRLNGRQRMTLPEFDAVCSMLGVSFGELGRRADERAVVAS